MTSPSTKSSKKRPASTSPSPKQRIPMAPTSPAIALTTHFPITDDWNKGMKSFQDSINEALRSAFPSGHQPYSHVNVLAIKFKNDDLKVTAAEGNLCQVFDKTYHYGITKHVLGKNINPKDTDDDQDIEAELELNNILSSFAIKHGGKGKLTIIVYNGHGCYVSDSYYLAGALDVQGNVLSPKVSWAGVKSVLAHQGDTLCIFDTCYAGQIAIRGGVEVLAAAGWNDIAGSSNATSFTTHLISELGRKPFQIRTVADIYSCLVEKAKDKFMHKMPGQGVLHEQPVHSIIPGKRSIVLVPLGSDPTIVDTTKIIPGQGPLRTLPVPTHRVLVKINFENEISLPSLEQWQEYLTSSLPSNIKSAEVEICGLFHGSSILLLTMPIEVFACLPDRQGITSMGLVTSGNLLLPRKSANMDDLPETDPLTDFASSSQNAPRPSSHTSASEEQQGEEEEEDEGEEGMDIGKD